jgi:hypothetical protein
MSASLTLSSNRQIGRNSRNLIDFKGVLGRNRGASKQVRLRPVSSYFSMRLRLLRPKCAFVEGENGKGMQASLETMVTSEGVI